MAISSDRLHELSELYKGLKKRILLIDDKYSLELVEPKLDMPDSLNLTKLVYTPKTEEELLALAEQSVTATILSKQATLDKNYNEKMRSFATQVAKIQISLNKKSTAAKDDYEKQQANYRQRLINNGLVFSTIMVNYENKAKSGYEEELSRLQSDVDAQLALVAQQQADEESSYRESCDKLAQEKQARIVESYNKLVEQEEKLARSIEKYNTGLDEKEQKYQASRARTYELALRAAYQRAYNNSKLYMEMGETGFRRAIEKEKYVVSQDVFWPLRREEAKAILSMDSFLRGHLGTYYDAFVDWVNTVLLP